MNFIMQQNCPQWPNTSEMQQNELTKVLTFLIIYKFLNTSLNVHQWLCETTVAIPAKLNVGIYNGHPT